METRRKTTAGVLVWTPAPVRPSLNSSDDAWEDEDEDQPAREDDFESQMDDNGIIGLSEVFEDVGLGEGCGDVDPDRDHGPIIKEEADLSGSERNEPSEELNYNLSERRSNTQSAGEETQPSCFDVINGLKAKTEDKKRHENLDITEEKEGKRNGRKRNKHKRKSTPGELGATKEEISSTSQSLEPAGLSNNHCLGSVPSPSLLHLLHFTPEELAAPGIEAETLPEMGFTESLSESHCSQKSLKLSPRHSEINLEASPEPEARVSEDVVSNQYKRVSTSPGEGSEKSDHRQPRRKVKRSPHSRYSRARSVSTVSDDSVKSKQSSTSSDRKPRSPRHWSKAAVEDESRKASLSYQTPDFSKVEPKIRFSKGSYKPPKSRLSVTSSSLSPEPPLMFKSPADIVKEVLLNTDGSAASSDCDRSPTGATNSTVPLDFRSKRNASTLLQQLQAAYNSLLTKYAEAENTIDRLRLEAKVNLYSDPPKPGHSVQAGLNHDASKFIKLDFPQAQKAEMSLHPNEHSSHQGSSAACASSRSPVADLGQQLASIIFNQTDKFLQQLQTFEHLLKSKRLNPSEQMKGLTQLSEGLDSLEKGYLLARDEHKVLQQRGLEISDFDPERELEGLIFQCGLRMDELKEQVEQMRREQPICEDPSAPQPAFSFTPYMAAESLIHPQIPPEPLLVDPGEAAQVEVSSLSTESELEDEETLNSLHFNPPNVEVTYFEQDFSMPDHYQSFKELPRLLDYSLREELPPSAALETELQPEDKNNEALDQENENSEVCKSLPQSETTSDPPDSPADSSKQWSSRSSPPSYGTSSQSTPVPPTSRSRLELKKSHSSSLSSLGDIPAERSSFMGQTVSKRAHSQDGIISPEMDSGFVGSESSRLTPAAASASSPVQQRASESNTSEPQEGNSGRPQTGQVSTSSPSLSPSSSHQPAATEPKLDSQFNPDQPKKTRPERRRRTFSCSPQRWVSQREQTPVDSDSTPTGSEDSDRCYRSIDSVLSSPSSSSLAARDAIQTLQAEVTRLKERLESCLKNKKSLSSLKAAPSVFNTSSPRIRTVEHQREASGGRRETQSLDEIEESVLRRTTRSASAQTQKTQQDMLRRSELDSSSPHPQVSRCTQTSAAADSSCQHTASVRSRRTQTMSEAADEPDSSRSRAFLCPQCLSGRRGRTERPAGGVRESTLSSTHCRRYPLCGRFEPNRCTEPDCRRHPESPDRTRSRRYCAAEASPALLEYRPVGRTPLLLFPSPLYVSPNSGSSSAGRGRRRRSLSVDKLLSVDGSLNRAIRAARNMKHTSRNMAQSLATGLQYQELLTQPSSH